MSNDIYSGLVFKSAIALDYAMEKLLEQLKINIEKIVYGAGSPNYYERTMEFLNSWETSKPIIKGNIVESELFQNTFAMQSDPDNFTHGSYWYTNNDVREFMAEIIFEGLSGPMFGTGFWSVARDAWTPTLIHLENGDFDRWFADAMRMQGEDSFTFNISFT